MTRLNASETDPSVQEEIFKTLLRTPHRSVDEILSIHRYQLERDPFLYGCLATYAVIEGQCSVRDLQDVFVATMFISEFSEHREAAWVMFQDLPPYRARRVVQYITGFAEKIKYTSNQDPMPTYGTFGLTYERVKDRIGVEIPSKTTKVSGHVARHMGGATSVTVDTYLVKHEAHGRCLNRFAVSAIAYYLSTREKNTEIMEGAILRAKQALKFLYAKAHLLPGGYENSWVNRCLFHDEVPKGTRLDAIKKLIASDDPTEQAQLIVNSRLPFPVVQSLVDTITPSVLIALISVMSPQELLANLAKLKREGAFNNPEIKELVQEKIKGAGRAKHGKVDAFKGEIAAAAVADLDDETKKLVADVTDVQLKQHGEISVSTALFIDKSYSMHQAIEEGKKIAAALAQAGGDKFVGCWLFNTISQHLSWKASDGDITQYSAWKKKFRMIRADGGTDPVVCLRSLINDNISVDQIILVTDEEENNIGRFAEGLVKYKKQFGDMPNIIIARLGGHSTNWMETSCKKVGADVAVMDCSRLDKIALPNLIQLCSKKSIFDLVQGILELPLPLRADYISKQERQFIRKKKTSSKKTAKKAKKRRDRPAMAS